MAARRDSDGQYELWRLIVHTYRAISKMRSRELLRYGVTMEEAAILFTLQFLDKDKATPAELSRWVVREPHSTSSLIKRMEKRGLVKTSRDLCRKNMVRVSVTEKGQRVQEQANIREAIHRVISVLSEEEFNHLSIYLRKLFREAIKEIRIPSKSFYLLDEES